MTQKPNKAEKLHIALLRLLEQGSIPWRQENRRPALGRQHRNLLSGGNYAEKDQMLLEVALVRRHSSIPLWCTFLEARQAGLTPRRGAEGVHIGWSKMEQKGFCVFNAAELVGPALQGILHRRRKDLQQEGRTKRGIAEKAESVLASWPVPMKEGEHLPRYVREQDLILLPRRQCFHSREAFLATWASLQIHSAGHPSRRPREPVEGRANVAKPADAFLHELAWCLLADRLGLERSMGPYRLTGMDWWERLQGSQDLFWKLLEDAGKTVDLLTGKGEAERNR